MDIQRPGILIQTIAKVLFVIELIGALICTIAFASSWGFSGFLIGISMFPAGFVVYAFIYGFGQLVDNSDTLVEQTRNVQNSKAQDLVGNNDTDDDLPEI